MCGRPHDRTITRITRQKIEATEVKTTMLAMQAGKTY